MVKLLLIRFHTWLGNKLGIIHICPVPEPHTCPPPPPLPDNILIIEPKIFEILPDISVWIQQQQACGDGVSGEYKRHQVYSRVIKQYPDIKESDLALAIEIAIQKLKGDNHGK